MPQPKAVKRQSAIKLYESAIAYHEREIAAVQSLSPATPSPLLSVAMIEEDRAESIGIHKAKIANLKTLIANTSRKH